MMMKAALSLSVTGLVLAAPSVALADWPPSNCAHVEVLDSSDTDEVSWRFDGTVTAIDGTLEDAGPNQLDALGEALDLMPEMLCQAVRKVAFVNRPPDESLLDLFGDDEEQAVVTGWTTVNDRQNVVYLNTHSLSPWSESSLGFSDLARHEAIHRAVHESTHAAVRLLQSQQKAGPMGILSERPDADLWPSEAQQMAKAIVKANRLNMGVIREWQRIHDQFVAAGMAKGYYGGDWVGKDGISFEALAGDGFMSAYGGEKAVEDIAEMASWAIVRGEASDPEDGACQVMNGRSDPGVKSEDAAVFTKLGFVRTLEFIAEEQYQDCVGSLKIDAPGPGFHSYRDGQLSRSYTDNPRAGVGREMQANPVGVTSDLIASYIANITADGTAATSSGDFPATVRLELNVTPQVDATPAEVSYPRGVYFVGERHSKDNRLAIRRREDDAVIMDVSQGVALVSRASSEGIEGSVFIQRIFNYSGGLLSAIAGDEPVKKPTKMTFRYDPQ